MRLVVKQMEPDAIGRGCEVSSKGCLSVVELGRLLAYHSRPLPGGARSKSGRGVGRSQ